MRWLTRLGTSLRRRWNSQCQECGHPLTITEEMTGHWSVAELETFKWCEVCSPDKFGILQFRVDKVLSQDKTLRTLNELEW